VGKINWKIMLDTDVKEKYKNYLNTEEGAANYNRFKGILYGTPDSLVSRIADSLSKQITKSSVTILDAGGGDGKRLRLLITLLAKKGIEVSATLVEPSRVFTNQLRETLIDEKETQIEVVQSLFETYGTDKKFDVILFIHSIYTFKDKGYIENIKRILDNDGLVFIASNDKGSFLSQLKQTLDASYSTKRREIDSVIRDLTEEGFVIEEQRSVTSFDDCLENGELTGDSTLIVEWLALRDLKDIPADILKTLITVFKENSHTGKINENEIFVLAKLKKQVR
jgi:SAM-dependent methyltransferase